MLQTESYKITLESEGLLHEPVSRLIHRIPKHKVTKPGKPTLADVDTLKCNTGGGKG